MRIALRKDILLRVKRRPVLPLLQLILLLRRQLQQLQLLLRLL